jgi:hypothetical protein
LFIGVSVGSIIISLKDGYKSRETKFQEKEHIFMFKLYQIYGILACGEFVKGGRICHINWWL